jgi:hypothetical protein
MGGVLSQEKQRPLLSWQGQDWHISAWKKEWWADLYTPTLSRRVADRLP